MDHVPEKLDRNMFIGYIFGCSCENCPISTQCKSIRAFSCTTSAKQFFRMYNKGGFILWQDIQALAMMTNSTPRKQ